MNRRELLTKTGAAGMLTLLQLSALRPVLAAAETSGASAALQIEVKRRQGDGYPVFDLRAHASVHATAQRAWEVLTNYDRLAEFVPNLSSSRLISRADRECVVAQEGYGQFLFIKQPIHLLVHVHETPFSNIALTLLKGNMHEYQANWAITAATAADNHLTQIAYTGTIAPAFYIPSLFGAAMMKSDLRNMIATVVREIEKPALK
jgi:ribosome-associated toxin RatA of RatAB toxin-antitoxin module